MSAGGGEKCKGPNFEYTKWWNELRLPSHPLVDGWRRPKMTQMSSNVPTKCPIMSLPTDCGKSIKISSQVPPGGLAECWQSSQPSDKRKSRQNPFYNKNVSITAKSTNSEKNVQNFHIFFPLATKWSFRTTPHRYFLSASRTNPPAVRRPFPFFFPGCRVAQPTLTPLNKNHFSSFNPLFHFSKGNTQEIER